MCTVINYAFFGQGTPPTLLARWAEIRTYLRRVDAVRVEPQSRVSNVMILVFLTKSINACKSASKE